MLQRAPGLFFVLVALPWVASAQPQPAGGEFQVNTYTTNSQNYSAAAMHPGGNFVVVWRSVGQDPDGSRAIIGQRYDAAGLPRGGEFHVNTYTTSDQSRPAVALDPQGNFVVVWQSDGQDGSDYGIFGQRYDATGLPLGAEFRVNTYTTGTQSRARIAMDAGGNFVVIWRSNGQDGLGFGVYGQRYDAAGVPRGGEFRVNTYTTNDQGLSAVAMDPAGNFVVVWSSDTQDGAAYGVFGQRYDAAGAPLGGEFQVNTYTTVAQYRPRVAMDPGGNFVVVWRSYGQDESSSGIFGQRYDAAGVKQGGEFQVNTDTTGAQDYPFVAVDATGNFVVVWESNTQDGANDGVFGQRYDAAGLPRGSEFQSDLEPVLSVHRDAVPCGGDGGVRGHQLLSGRVDDAGADGGVPATGARGGGVHPAAVHDGAIPGRAVREPVRGVGAGAGGAGDHRRLRRGAVLPDGSGDPGADGGVPAEDEGRSGLHAAGVHDGDVHRRAVQQPLRAVGAGAGGAGDHRGLRDDAVLSDGPGDAGPDGRLPDEDLRPGALRAMSRRPPQPFFGAGRVSAC
jgi:hypothetical protein